MPVVDPSTDVFSAVAQTKLPPLTRRWAFQMPLSGRRPTIAWLIATLFATSAIALETDAVEPGQLLQVAVTGQVTATGPDDPQWVLSFVPVQQLVLDATRGPISRATLVEQLSRSPVELEDLVRLELLRCDESLCRLGFLVLTRDDQRRIAEVGSEFARSLSDAFVARRVQFSEIWDGLRDQELRRETAFVLVAGVLLNWEGLQISSDLGYRIDVPPRPNGDRYVVHAREAGARADGRGQFLASHTAPGGAMMFSTFGDGASYPRLHGLPNLLEETFERGFGAVRDQPRLASAVQAHAIAYILEQLDDAGRVIERLAAAPADRVELDAALSLPSGRMKATLDLLEAIGYIAEENGRYRNRVLVLTEADREPWLASLVLGREIVTKWLHDNYSSIEAELTDLSSIRSGLPFGLAFNEIWHEIFGEVTGLLAATGFYLDPYADGWPTPGYVAVVWKRDLADSD